MVNKIKETALKVWNMVNGKDKNLDGKVDIHDAMLEAKQKAKKKILSYLKKIYNGIDLANSSTNKVYAEVSLVGIRTVQVNIIGEVKVPGSYNLNALSTVLNGLYASGGPTVNGSFRNIKIYWFLIIG